jgi:hypothetical protein
METEHIDELLGEIARLKEGCKLLEEIWGWYGPYGPEKAQATVSTKRRKGKSLVYDYWVERMSDDLQGKLQRFFGFDDSE